jgi:hypothetical protein
MSGRKSIAFIFSLQLPSQVVATPTSKSIVNNFDYIGDIVSLKRLDNETNANYKKRIWDVNVHHGGPDYEGVLNNIGRELGMLREKTLTIDLKLDSAGQPIAPNPRVDILANKVVLYSDWRPGGVTEVIDREIRTYQLGDVGYYLDDLVTAINQSNYFSAVVEQGIRSNLISSTLVRTSSDRQVADNYIHTDNFIELDYNYIVQGSLAFSEKGVFETEVTGTLSADGEYSVNYVLGEVLSYTLPSGIGFCSYHTAAFPLVIDSLPVQLFSFQDDNFQYELFEKQTLDSGEQINSLPTAEGSEIYHQLFMNTEVFWGD